MVAEYGGEEIRTIIVSGFPADCAVRECDNLCRYMVGFNGAKVDCKKGMMLFVLFDSADNAQVAVQMINGSPFDRSSPAEILKAGMAKNNMKSDPGHASMAQGKGSSAWGAPAWGAPKAQGKGVGSVDTITCPSSDQEGFDAATIEAVVSSLNGFVAFKAAVTGQCFIKFASPELAAEAMTIAQQQGLPAQMARSSMGAPSGGGGAPDPSSAWQGAPKRARLSGPLGIDTLVHLRASDLGFDSDALHGAVFALQGFMAFKPNPRMGGGFSKFESPELAAEAMAALQAQGMPAEWAKSSMTAL